jgi:hypothetical protein
VYFNKLEKRIRYGSTYSALHPKPLSFGFYPKSSVQEQRSINTKFLKPDMIPLSGKNVGSYTFNFASYFEMFSNSWLQESYKFSGEYTLIF